MGRIKKAASSKHDATVSPALSDFASKACRIPLAELPAHLSSFPRRWPFPRGDLYHWIDLLDRFDAVLEKFIDHYHLKSPQTRPFDCSFLAVYAEDGDDVQMQGFGPHGDLQLVQSILEFSRLLLEKCGNRSLYGSGDRLNNLLNTTSLSLLHTTLRLALCLAQRVNARQRPNSFTPGSAMLKNYYAIDLDNLQQLSLPLRQPNPQAKSTTTATPIKTPKGKDRPTRPSNPRKSSSGIVNANDLVRLASSSTDTATQPQAEWEPWAVVEITARKVESEDEAKGDDRDNVSVPDTPTRSSPLRRSSHINGTETDRHAEEAGRSLKSAVAHSDQDSSSLRVAIQSDEIHQSSIEHLIEKYSTDLPPTSQYELLTRCRAAKALTTSPKVRQELLAVRLLAVSNLSYIYSEPWFLSKVVHHESEEPKRWQLVSQLAEILSYACTDTGIPLYIQTLALGTLRAFSKHKSKLHEILTALSINVNHGALLSAIRKGLEDMAKDHDETDNEDGDEWREAVFSLLHTLVLMSPPPTRHGESFVPATMILRYVDVLNLRTEKAQRVYLRVLEFFETFCNTVKDGLTILSANRAIEAIADLINFEVNNSLKQIEEGNGLGKEYRTQSTDYSIPYFNQQTIRFLLPFVDGVIGQGGTAAERILRNLIDSPPFLEALKQIMENSQSFGSHVWSSGIKLMSNFLHNEPTSYSVLAEAGLTQSFLASIGAQPPPQKPKAARLPSNEASEDETSSEDGDTNMGGVDSSSRAPKTIDAMQKIGNAKVGILASPEAISSVSQAFSAICLTTTGFNSFKASGALEIFFDLFQSPSHIKSMTEASYLQSIGNTFDEFARHHPGLRLEILSTVIVMVSRLRALCKLKTLEVGAGTKLWVDGPSGKVEVAGGTSSLIAGTDAFESSTDYEMRLPNGDTLVVESSHSFRDLVVQKVTEDERDEYGLTVSDYISPVMWFLLGFFENQALCSSFVDHGAVELIMDIVTAPSLPYDLFQDGNAGNSPLDMAQVIHMMADTKPHLVVPSLMHRVIQSVRSLENFATKQPNDASCFFDPLIGNHGEASQDRDKWVRDNGTKIARGLASCLNLTRVFHEVYSAPMYHTRQSQQPSPFTHSNLVDRYVELCHRLGEIHAACTREAIMLQEKTPKAWREETRLKDFGTGVDEADEMLGLVRMPTEISASTKDKGDEPEEKTEDKDAQLERDKQSADFRNVKILRSLLSQVPFTITQFFQVLGMGLVPKRRMDLNAKQNVMEVADAIAHALIQEFDPPFFRSAEHFPSDEKFREHKFAYLIVVLANLSAVVLDLQSASPHSPATTSVLIAVKKAHGIERVRELGNMFYDEVNKVEGSTKKEDSKSSPPSPVDISLSGLKMILNFFSLLTSSKTVVDATQANALKTDRDRPYSFVPSQLLLELRMEVLPLVRKIWSNNTFIERASNNTIEGLIFALRHILEGDSETDAYKASENVPPSLLPSPRRFMPSREKMSHLKDMGFDEDLVREALFRCNNARDASEEYCQAYKRNPRVPRNPVRPSDLETSTPDPRSTPRRESSEMSISRSDSNVTPSFPSGSFSTGAAPLLRDILSMTTGLNIPESATQESEILSDSTNGANTDNAEESGAHLAMSLDNILNPGDPPGDSGRPSQAQGSDAPETSEPQLRNAAVITVEDIDAQRDEIRSDLAERCLDVLNVHHNVTFELAELVTAASNHLSPEERAEFRSSFGDLLVNTVVSTQVELDPQENTQPAGKRVAAHAHLLALLLQDKDMYTECLDSLKDSFSDLVKFIRVAPASDGKPAESSSPWVGQILLVFERMLSDDAEPQEVPWNPDTADPEPAGSRLTKDIVSPSEKKELFDAVVDVLPRIGKDTALALSVARVLVILTRDRTLAAMLGEKRNLQRLFVMIKQLGGATNDRLQAAFMIVLRHIIEDEGIIRQIMRSEIVANFETRSARQVDTAHYPRQMYHLSLRSPEIFVEVTSEKLKIQNYKEHQRPQDLVLKTEGTKDVPDAAKTSATQETKPAEHDLALQTTESGPGDEVDGKTKLNLKLPTIEHPDGVIHFLLSELMSYKDVEEKEITPPQAEKDQSLDAGSDTDSESTSSDIPYPRSQPSTSAAPGPNKPERSVFKAEDHPIYIYRCFLLQCLTELLHSYNRTKIEFVSFSRRADPAAVTPSKARSGVLHYFLQSLIPLKSLNHDDSNQHKKKLTVSDWAMRVIIALCSKTGEHGSSPRERYTLERFTFNESVNDDGEQEVNIVREFVLQHALKAFKDANGSLDPPDAKYARMLGLAELFNKLLARPSLSDGEAGSNNNSYKTIAKMMFQKNFISLLTASIADLDLSFSGSKRLAKSILKPLDQLTSAALQLSLNSDTVISSPLGQADEDQISSASSVSEMDDEREETPDLFRNSALGMLDPNRQEGSDSDEDEEDDEDDNEMYEEDYEDEMEYEEDMNAVPDDGEVVSDEDVDEMEEHGPVEGLPGDVPLDLELVMEGEDATGDTDDDDESEDDDDDDLDDEEIEMDEDDAIMAGEINGDDENASLADDDGDIEWESDHEDDEHDHDDEGDLDNADADIDDVVDQATTAAGNAPPSGPISGSGPLSNILQVLGGLRDSEVPLEDMLGQEMEEGMDEDDDNDEEDGDELDENDEDDAPYQTLEEILDDESSAPWAWDPIAPGSWPPRPHHHHHHHHHHHFRGPGGFPSLGGGPMRGLPISSIGRTRHIHSTHSGNDDGTNPLLHRNGTLQGLPGAMPPIDIFPGLGGGFMVSSGSGSGDMFEMIMQAVQRGDGRVEMSQSGGRFDIRFDGVPSDFRNLMRGIASSTSQGGNSDRNDPITAVKFRAAVTTARWQEEAKILYGAMYSDKVTRLQNPILRVLVPPAIEEEKAREKRRQEEARRREEEQRERERQERLAREEAEKKRKEEEEREAAARVVAEAEAAAAAAQAQAIPGSEVSASEHTEPMQGVQASEGSTENSAATVDEPTQAQATPRVYTTIRGRQLDITDLAIDAQFLEELPEEIREEVIMQQYAEQRHQAQEQGQPPTEINPEFLDALPEEIREELLAQEINERRRREREAQRRRAAEAGGPARAEEMDPDSFMASLDPSLRRSILADQPDEIIANLAPEFAAEARQMLQSQLRHMNRIGIGREPREDQTNTERQPQKETKKQVVQMVDKAGVATLLRLMFMPHHGTTRTTLHNILNNICEHRQTRAEVVSLLLLILQDGTADIGAVERSLAHLSLRAKTPSAQKTPQPLKRAMTLQSNQAGSEVTPIMIVQQCLAALESLTSENPHISPVFLRELEPSSHRSKSAKKGKGKEDRASKFAINALLSLLDRSLITENAACMDTLAKLLLEITKPLPWLLKKEKPDETAEGRKVAIGDQDAPSASGEPSANAEQSAQPNSEALPSSQNDVAMTEAPLASQTTDEPQTTADNSEVTPAASSAEKQKSAEEQKAKKLFEPPVIPDQNLRLVVGVLAAREMNAKIFQNTLSTITYLSILPRAREVFGKELVSQAESLSQNILPDLNELLVVLQNAQSGPEVHGPAVEKFTTPGADQSKFLRVLMAVDYLFSVKRGDDGKGKTEEESSGDKEGFLNALYGSAGFGPLWAKLSDCLTIIRQKEGMTSVSTILLSLIESLMVVCKNTSLKDSLISRSLRERSVQSPISETGVEDMFYNFTEEHRKVLNELVRMNPKLMTGNFSVLVKNPKVLEFDNKRSYFNRQIHTRPRDARHHQPPLQLSVRRDQVFLDSFKSLYFKSAEEMKYGKLSIRFHGEEGVDAGGVTREWFQVLARGMFNPNYALFIPVASDRTTFHPNRLSGVNNEHLMFFKFIGRIIGKALYEGRVLDCHFSRAVYKRILGKSVSIKDMETLDLDYYKSLVWMLENDITDIITETFSVETDDFGETQIIDLIENGRNIPVTEENKQEYVQLVVEYRLTGSVKEQLENFLKGFHDIIPAELIAIFNEQELELLISGLPDIDIDDWKANTEYHNYSASSQQIQWFWRAVRSFDKEEQAKLLQFVTGTSKVPLNGFKELEGMNGFSRFNIHKDYGNKDRLPSSHTCFNQLDLPEYDSYDTLRQRLYMAMTTGSEYFGFA